MLTPEKRYQIFISSTFTDLKEERAIVSEAILEINQMPYGMEVFPAANESQWEWIKRAIEESDYYIVIIGGKYGSINKKTGVSYTEMEYRYAEEVGVPTIAFLVDESVDLPKSKIDTDPVKVEKLKAFREYIEGQKMRKSYLSKEDLKAKVITSLVSVINQFPREGWIRTKSLKNYTSNDEVIRLMKENDELKAKLSSGDNLLDGEDVISIDYKLRKSETYGQWKSMANVCELQIDELFSYCAMELYHRPLTDMYMSSPICLLINSKLERELRLAQSVTLSSEELKKILFQLEALEYICKKEDRLWHLTEKGRKKYILSKALKKD